jgi:hypothetical protein
LFLGISSPEYLYADDDLQELMDRHKIDSSKILDMAKKRFQAVEENAGGNKEEKSLSVADVVYNGLEPFRKMGESGTSDWIEERLEERQLTAVSEYIPYAVIDFVAALLVDPRALPTLAMIPEKRSRLYTFYGILLGSFVLGIVWRFVSSHRSIGRRIMASLWRVFILYAIRFGSFIFLFQVELAPLGRLIKARLLG